MCIYIHIHIRMWYIKYIYEYNTSYTYCSKRWRNLPLPFQVHGLPRAIAHTFHVGTAPVQVGQAAVRSKRWLVAEAAQWPWSPRSWQKQTQVTQVTQAHDKTPSFIRLHSVCKWDCSQVGSVATCCHMLPGPGWSCGWGATGTTAIA